MHFDAHQLAVIGLVGLALNAFGTLYLAYDLLGGEEGPLHIVTRVLTYGAIFVVGYGVFLGVRFGLIAGVALGGALAFELPSAARKKELSKTPHVILGWCAAPAFGLGVALTHGAKMGAVFAVVASIGLTLTYFVGFSPSHSARRPDAPAHRRLRDFAHGARVGRAVRAILGERICMIRES